MGGCASRRAPSLEDFYELEAPETALLGEGSCSSVFCARSRATGLSVAVKRLERQQLDAGGCAWEQEVALLRRCAEHPNVVTLHDVLETPTHIYIITELAEGGELFQALIDEGAYSEWDARRFAGDIFRALRFLHEQHITHRDIKPENLLLTSTSAKLASIQLADFGVAALIDDASLLKNDRLTWAYCAPEVFQASSASMKLTTPVSGSRFSASTPAPQNTHVGTQSDMWSVGVVLFVLLSGRHPFDPDGRQTRDQIVSYIRLGVFSMASERWDAISEEAKALISSLLSVEPNERPTAAQALKHAWFMSDETPRASLAVSLSDDEGLEQYRRAMRRKFRTSVLATVAVETLRRSLKSRQSVGSTAGSDATIPEDACTAAGPEVVAVEPFDLDDPILCSSVASSCRSSSTSISAAVSSNAESGSPQLGLKKQRSALSLVFQKLASEEDEAATENLCDACPTTAVDAVRDDDISVEV